MDAGLFQAIYLLTGHYTMNAVALPMPHTVKIDVDEITNATISQLAEAVLTTNATPMFGYQPGKILLKRADFAKVKISVGSYRGVRTEKTVYEVAYEWDMARDIGGIPSEAMYKQYDHKTLPGVK